MRISKIFHSMYIKWTVTFVVLLFIAQAATAAFSFRAIISETADVLADTLERKAALLTRLHGEGHIISTDTLAQLGHTDIEMRVLWGSADVLGRDEIGGTRGLDWLAEDVIFAEIDGFVFVHENMLFHSIPHGIFDIGGTRFLLSPGLPYNELTLLVDGIARAMIFNIILSSLFVSVALVFIILKIRRVTAAAREVARGNFDVELFTRSQDEVGELMHNFNVMTKELRRSVYLKKDFVSSVSHEFKTPITAIEGFAKLLRNPELSPEQFNEYTDIIIRETSRLGGLSSNLLRLTLLDNSDFQPPHAPFYLDEQIRSTILLLERAWDEKNISFDIDMAEMLYNGNEELLSQVWINILQNAVKFSPQGGTIGVVLRMAKKNNRTVRIEISDGGPGIAPQHQDKIFERFYKGSAGETEGNGLGLPIAKRIVELCRGEIGFESTAGRTVFFVELPLELRVKN